MNPIKSGEEFDEIIKQHDNVVINFTSSTPEFDLPFEKLMDKFPSFIFYLVDRNETPSIFTDNEIPARITPTIQVYRKGDKVDQFPCNNIDYFVKRLASIENVEYLDTVEEYNEKVHQNNGKLIIVNFIAKGCPVCKVFTPLYRLRNLNFPMCKFYLVLRTKETLDIFRDYKIRHAPVIQIFRNAILQDQFVCTQILVFAKIITSWIPVRGIRYVNSLDDYKEIVNRDELSLICFRRDGCSACDQLKTLYREMFKKMKNKVKFYYVDIMKFLPLAKEKGVTHTPTIQVCRNGKVLEQEICFKEKDLKKLIDNYYE